MIRSVILTILSAFVLSACTAGTQPTETTRSGQKIFRVNSVPSNQVLSRHVDAVNEIRLSHGLTTLELSSQLNTAAQSHSVDMAAQQRPWHFGSDGSSPMDRVSRTGYPGQMRGENISETYENDIETLQAWMQDTHTRAVILDPTARFIGFGWHQETNGKLWWTQVTGG